jgi:hypothetical protein
MRYVQHCCFSGLRPSFSILKWYHYILGPGCSSIFRWKYLFCWLRWKGLGIGVGPFYRTVQNRCFHLKMGAESAPETFWSRFRIQNDVWSPEKQRYWLQTVCFSESLVSTYKSTRRYIPEEEHCQHKPINRFVLYFIFFEVGTKTLNII